jgi:hypothetical protein
MEITNRERIKRREEIYIRRKEERRKNKYMYL